MFTITDAAGQFLNSMLAQAEAPDESAARVVLEGQSLSLRLDSERPGDETFEHEGRTVLLVDSQLKEMLGDKTLDVTDTEEGKQLALS